MDQNYSNYKSDNIYSRNNDLENYIDLYSKLLDIQEALKELDLQFSNQ